MAKLPVILASKAVRRKTMLDKYGIESTVIIPGYEVPEEPVAALSKEDAAKEIAMRKALATFDITHGKGARIIVSADQSIVFEDKMYNKPKTINEARDLIQSMIGSDQIYAYVGNAILFVDDNDKIYRIINKCDIARLKMDKISIDTLEQYLLNGNPLARCGGVNVTETPFLHLAEGRESTAIGMTIEYLLEVLNT